MPKKFSGFTLIELLVVISIIAILSTVGLVSFQSVRNRALDAKVKADLDSIKKAYEQNYEPSLNGGQGGYQQLQDSDFASGKIPAQPNGSSYDCELGPGCGISTDQGFKVSAVLSNGSYAVTSTGGTISGEAMATCDPTDTLKNGLVGYWKMDEEASPFADSVASPAHDVSWIGAVGSVTGKLGNAGNFSGDNDNPIYAANNSGGFLPSGSSPRTITFWFKPNTTKPGDIAVGYGCINFEGRNGYTGCNSGGLGRYVGAYAVNNSIGLYLETCPVGGPYFSSPGSWHLYTAVFNGDNTITFYIDGQSPTTVTPGCTINTNSGKGISIGAGRWGYYKGSLDDVRVYNRALSAGEVSLLYNNGNGCI